MAIIALEGMSFFAHHGLYEEEKQHGNHFEVDLKVDTGHFELSASDDILHTLDYVQLYRVVTEVMATRVDLLETLVLGIGRKVVAEFKGIHSVEVKVSKLNPPLGGPCTRATVQQKFFPPDAA